LCVYPNFSKITLSPDWKITEVALGFKPTAVVVVKLVSAKDLAKKSGLSGIISSIVGQNLPDPYATITFGSSLFKTDVVKNCQNPIWSENEFVFLLDTPNGHKIKVDFYDEDALSRDGYLGYISKDIGSIPQGEVLNETLELLLNDEIDNDSGTPKKGKGKATFEFQILPLKQGKVFIKKLSIPIRL
jgi:Ca2+-dependent lipid-binding protein